MRRSSSPVRQVSKDQCSLDGRSTTRPPVAPPTPREQEIRRRQRARSAAVEQEREREQEGSVRHRSKPVAQTIAEELATLRARVVEQAARRAEVAEQLQEARRREAAERKAMLEHRHHTEMRTLRLTQKLQAVLRGWLVRRRIVKIMAKVRAKQLGLAAMLPDQLRDQLVDLQHSMHDLKYHDEHHEAAAVRIQAFWRGILGRRIVVVLRVAQRIRAAHQRLNVCATRVGTWFRAVHAQMKYRFQIHMRMQARRDRMAREMEAGLRIVVTIQRAVRARIARKMVAAARAAQQELADKDFSTEEDPAPQTAVVDTWQPGGLAAGPAAIVDGGLSGEGARLPRSERELAQLEAAGLLPFYSAAVQDTLRHRIGGVQARAMAVSLCLDASTDEEEGEWSPPGARADFHVKRKGDSLWDVYPQGLSAGFLEDLDRDAWPWPREEDRRRRRRGRRPPEAPQKRPCTRIVGQAPAHATRRALQREAAEAAAQAAAEAEGERVVEEAHPLFDNAPPVPVLPLLPPGRRGPAAASPRDGASWEGARTFLHCPGARGRGGAAAGAAALSAAISSALASKLPLASPRPLAVEM